MSKGKVLRPDDGRLGPHPERGFAIAKGIAHTNWSHRQSQLAQDAQPHALVPMTEKAAQAFAKHPQGRPQPTAGECHWCYFWRVTAPHIDGDPDPASLPITDRRRVLVY